MKVMKLNSLTAKQQKWILIAVLICISIYYLTQLTHFGIWYDEGIEYFYSKYMNGPLPDNIAVNAEGTQNMYDRISLTYQPPLYNFVMYLWLSIFDSEMAFRLIGLILTIIGAIGVYRTLRTISVNFYGSLIGVVVYLTLPCVAFFAVESAEYNLMLCFVAWALYYFCKCMQDNNPRKNKRNFIKYIIFGCLAVYSQYGAILTIAIGYLILLFIYFRRKDSKMIRTALIGGGIAVVVFGLPLLFLFLLPQMQLQGSADISHAPVFVKNVLYSLWYGVEQLSDFVFKASSSRFSGVIVALFALMSVAAIFYRNKTLKKLWLIVGINYILYFILVTCSLYAYNDWDGALGCNNLGKRYVLYMVPIVFITFYYGIYLIYNRYIRQGKYKSLKTLILCGLILVYIIAIARLSGISEKSNGERDAFEAWYDAKGYDYCTIVENFENPAFQFYYMHSDKYDSTKGNMIGEGDWSRRGNPSVIYDNLTKLGVLSKDTVLLVCSSNFAEIPKLNNHDEAMFKAGYKAEYILDRRGDSTNNRTSVVRYTKPIQ